MKTIDAAKGRWREILARFGIDETALNGKHHACPATGEGTDRFRFTDRNGSGSYFCACSQGDKGGIALLMCKLGAKYADVAKQVDEAIGNTCDAPAESRRPTYAQQLRGRVEKVARSSYLANRGLEVPPGLDWCRSVEYRDDDGRVVARHAAMLAPITRGGEFITYHVTYLDHGAKASVPTPRKILPGPATAGGACALYPPAETMGIAEGVETSIAAKLLHDVPVWAALNTALLRAFEPPPECRHLLVFADNDSNCAGQAAGYALAHRYSGKLDSVTVFLPPNPDEDWNDVWLRRRSNVAA